MHNRFEMLGTTTNYIPYFNLSLHYFKNKYWAWLYIKKINIDDVWYNTIWYIDIEDVEDISKRH